MKSNRAVRVLVLALMLLTAACGEKIEPGNTAPVTPGAVQAQVATAGVTRRTFLYEAVGTVTAEAVDTLSSKLMGTVRAIRVREGDRVQANDLLVVIDPRQVDAQLRQSEAGLAEARQAQAAAVSARDAARAAARLARATYERYLGLQRDNSVSRQEFDEIEARYRQAEASLAQTEAALRAAVFRIQQAEAAVAGASVSEKDAAIHAPYDGIVTAKLVEVGDLAAPGTPLLTLEGIGGHRVDLLLPEAHLQSVKPGQTVNVRIPAIGENALPGTVRTIAPAADQRTRSFLVKVRLPERADIRSGLFARVELPVGEAVGLVVTALGHRGPGSADRFVPDRPPADGPLSPGAHRQTVRPDGGDPLRPRGRRPLRVCRRPPRWRTAPGGGHSMNAKTGAAGKIARFFIDSKLTPLIIIASHPAGRRSRCSPCRGRRSPRSSCR